MRATPKQLSAMKAQSEAAKREALASVKVTRLVRQDERKRMQAALAKLAFNHRAGGHASTEETISAESAPPARTRSSYPATFEPLGGYSLPNDLRQARAAQGVDGTRD